MATSNWSSSVLSGLSTDTEPTIVVTFPNAKYVFNVGENTGRAWLQSRLNWKKTKGLFFTSAGTQRMSGLPGLLMSLADGGIRHLNLVGPQGLMHFLAAMRLYTYREKLGLNTIELKSETSSSPVYTDENITLYSLPIYPEPSNGSLKRKRESSPLSASKRPSLESSDILTTSIPLLERMRLPGFSPTMLLSEEAEEWRKLTVDHMFPWIEPPRPKTKQPKGILSFVREPEPYVSRKSQYSFNPSGNDKQLPMFTFTKSGEPVSPIVKPTLAYVLVGPHTRGKFDSAKAKELGLVGRLRGQVASGQTVTFLVKDTTGKEVERTVRPEDCVGPSESPGVVIVLDIPSLAHIPALVSSFADSSFFAKFRSNREEDQKEFSVHLVHHICGEGVLEDDRYKSFMRGFSSGTHHLISSREHNSDPVTFTNAACNQLRLNQLDEDMFPIPKYSLNPSKQLKDVPDLPSNVSVLSPNILTEMRPTKPPKLNPLAEEIDSFHSGVSQSTPPELPASTLEKFTQAQGLVETFKTKERILQAGDSVTIIPLGTSSALPTKYRNVSGNLIRIPKWGNILLESGEGSWGQLARYFGTSPDAEENVWTILRDIKCIFVSHAHGDHHIGLAKVLAMRKTLEPPPSEPLYLVTHHSVHLGLREVSDLEDLGIDYNPTKNGVIPVYSNALHYKLEDAHLTESQRRSQAVIQNLYQSLGLKKLSTVEVWHRGPCLGVIIDHQDGWRIVFSGDTRPTDKLVEAGQNATLLIHEATMADDQVEMARAKGHSTVGQAIEIGKRMNAKNILLTHFSARYPKMPPSIVQTPATEQEGPAIGLAFDHTNIRLGELWKLNMYLPAIEKSFGDTAEEGDDESDSITLQAGW